MPETSGLAGIHLFMVVRTEQYFATWTTVTYLINVRAPQTGLEVSLMLSGMWIKRLNTALSKEEGRSHRD